MEPPVKFDLMGEPSANGGVTYDRIFVGDEAPFDVKLWQRHVPELYTRFPDNKKDIDKYVREATQAVDSVPLFVLSKLLPLRLQELVGPYLLRTFRRQAGRTMKEALADITQNPRLAALLGSLWIDTGSPPEKVTRFGRARSPRAHVLLRGPRRRPSSAEVLRFCQRW
jgi:hypothetical protein